MDTYGPIAGGRARRHHWAGRSRAFEGELVEHLAQAREALKCSRDVLNVTSQILPRSPLVDAHRTTLPGRGLNI